MSRPPRDIAASVRHRLLNLARERREEFEGLLTRYALERLLYRLACSKHRDRLILKGAMLFAVWSGEPHRATRDLDLLGRGESDMAYLADVFRDICQVPSEEDGLEFVGDSIRVAPIREDQEYEGVRIQLTAKLSGARISLQVDVGFGDVITPGPDSINFPTLLDLPAPRLLAYPRETVVAEKFQAMVMLGIANSRMKDFYDVWVIARTFPFDGILLSQAIHQTFSRRRTVLPQEDPLALRAEFSLDLAKQQQWKAFLNKGRIGGQPGNLDQVVSALRDFLMPPTQALTSRFPFDRIWPASGPWQSREGEHQQEGVP